MTGPGEKPRPVKLRRVVGRQVWRIPDKGYVAPRLRDDERKTEAIGFRAHIGGRWSDEADD